MKLVKDLAAFAVTEGWMVFLLVMTVFSIWATSGALKTYRVSSCDYLLMAVAMTACVVLNVAMVLIAVKLTADAFSEFRASRENNPA